MRSAMFTTARVGGDAKRTVDGLHVNQPAIPKVELRAIPEVQQDVDLRF